MLFRFLLTLLLAALPAGGAVIYSGVQNISISTTYDGTWLDFRNGADATDYTVVSDVPEPASFDLNFFLGGAAIWNSDTAQAATDTGATNSRVLNLAPGTEVGPSLNFPASFSGSLAHMGPGADQWASGSTPTIGFIGVRIQASSWNTNPPDENSSCWIRVSLRDNGSVGTIIDWAWEDSGAPLLAGQIPEPGVMTLLAGLLAAALLRRRR